MAAAADNLSIKVTDTGTTQAARNFLELGKQLATVDQRTAAWSKTTQAANTNQSAFNEVTGKTVRSVQSLTAAFGQVFPELGKFQGVIGQGVTAVQTLTGAIGGGPGALIAGGAIAVIGLLGKSWQEESKKAEDFAKATKKATDEVNKNTVAVRIAAAQAKEADRSFWDKLAAGAGSGQDYDAAIAKATEGIKTGKSGYGDRSANIRAQEFYTRMKAEAAAAEQQEAQDDFDGLGDGKGDKKTKGAKKDKAPTQEELARGNANQARIAKLKQLEEESTETQKRYGQLRLIDTQKIEADKRKLEAEFAKSNAEDFEARSLDKRNTWAEETAAFQAEEERRHAISKAFSEDLKAFGLSTAQASTKALTESAKGHKILAGAILEGLGDQMVAKGTMTLFEGLAMSVLGNPAGPALVGIGGAEIAAGTALGAIGARGAGGSSSGGGGGGRGGGSSSGGSGPASPLRSANDNSSRQSSQPQVVNIYLSSVVTPTADDGRRIEQARRAARRTYGDNF